MLKNLSILKDKPLFGADKGLDTDQDAFNHQAYAEAIFKIIQENPPPLSIGLFGPWGIGKSTVVNMLFALIRASEHSKLKPVYFNAWKYSGDSFRRQFLIAVAEEVYKGRGDRDAKIRRLEQLNYTEVLREENDKKFFDQLKEIFTSNVKFKQGGIARFVYAGVIAVIGGLVAFLFGSIHPFLYGLILASIVSLLGKPEDIFVLQKAPVYDPKLIFPEQFEAEFRNLISSAGPLGGARAVIAIDDIDRCEPDAIRDILISIKTFVGEENCYFIVPCDDKSVVKVFEDPNHKEGYKDEMLRKYFNIGVRMAPLMATDLMDFANSVSKQTGIPQEIVQMAILGNCHDARKMKHFLNTFVAKYAVAKIRQDKGFIPVDIDENLVPFAKVVLMEDLYPDLFEKMVERPEIYGVLERAALGEGVENDLKRLALHDWQERYPNLKGVLERTRDTTIKHIELFFSLKTTNPESRIPRGYDLKNAILRGDGGIIDEVIKQIPDDNVRANLGQLLIDIMERATHIFLKNTISASLDLYHRDGVLLLTDKTRVATSVSYALLDKEEQKVLQHSAIQVLESAKNAGGRYPAGIIAKYEQELGQLETPPEDLAETINALYPFASNRGRLASILNKNFESWLSNETALSVLTQLQMPEKIETEERVPSPQIVEKVASGIAADANENTIKMNRLRTTVVFKYWDERFAVSMGERLLGILQQSAQSETADSPRNAFVIGIILENPSCLEPKFTPQIWPQIQQVYNRTKDWKHQIEAHKVLILLAASAPDTGVKNAAQTFVTQNWQSFSDKQLRDGLKYINTLEEPGRTALKTVLLQQELTLAQNEMQNPSDRTKERLKLCYENRKVVAENPLKQFLLKTLDTPDAAFAKWRVEIINYASKFRDTFAFDAATKALTLAGGSPSQQKRQGLLELFAELLAQVDDEGKARLLPKYFDLCKNADANVRDVAVGSLEGIGKVIEEADFRLRINSLFRDLCDIGPSNIASYRQSIDMILKQQKFLGEDEWRSFGAMVKRLLLQSDAKLQEYGLQLCGQIPKFPGAHEEDLVRQLVNIAIGGPGPQKEAAAKLLNDLGPKVGSKGKKVLKEYRESIEANKADA